MRVERTGKIELLTPRVIKFLENQLNATCIDEIQSHEELRIDYTCWRGLLAIEIKTLEEDGSSRLNNLTDELRKRDDWPEFLGSAPIQSFLKNTSDPEGLHRKTLDRIGRAILNHLKKANKQLEAHKFQSRRKNTVGIMLLINEDHVTYNPDTVSYVVSHALKRKEAGKPLYQHVDAVVYLTERHATIYNGRLVFPVTIIDGEGIVLNPWKSSVISKFARCWGNREGAQTIETDDASSHTFSTIDHIPDSAPRHERWRTDYRRTPYLRRLEESKLRDRFDEITLLSSFAFVKDSPIKVSSKMLMQNMAHFTHMMEEMAYRAIPITSFPLEHERQLLAAKRIGISDEGINWLKELGNERNQ